MRPLRILLALAFGGCATVPSVYSFQRARTTVVWAESGQVERAFWAAVEKSKADAIDDFGFPIRPGRVINGFAVAQPNEWCEIWISWTAQARTVLHELAECERWPKVKLLEVF